MFRVDPSKVSSAGVRARCSVCGGVITIGAGTSIDEEFDMPQVEARPTPVRAPDVIDTHRPPAIPTPPIPVVAEPAPIAAPTPSETPVAVDAQAVEATSIQPQAEPTPILTARAPTPAGPPTISRPTPPVSQPAGVRSRIPTLC